MSTPAEMVFSTWTDGAWVERRRLPHVDPVPALDQRRLTVSDITPVAPVAAGERICIAYLDANETTLRAFVFDVDSDVLRLVETEG